MSNLLTKAEKMQAVELVNQTATAVATAPLVEPIYTPATSQTIVANGLETQITNFVNGSVLGIPMKTILIVGGGALILWNFVLDTKTKRKLKFW